MEDYSNRHQAAAVHHKQDPGLARSPRLDFFPLFLFVFLLLVTLPLLTDTEMTNVPPPPQMSETPITMRQLDKVVAIQPCAGITMNEFSSIKKRTEEECKIIEKPRSSRCTFFFLKVLFYF